ncbi:MAG: preprotein translocase subunit SecY [Gammaproteobacteria bacterium]|jgi:preprotein translocase subunit SecY|nr:preprotein translocase subunit SecY [Gammaproteobacteria bacterium]MDG2171840.1 preprotein translocase subunit SecY [Gammaproteobacteria bacterium]|tara:strand:- start:1804 stop:3078 length:1275 start_codon:yes stop_codon:yes gene_type:complete
MEELRKRLFFVFGAILVYRIGTYIPVPGINPAALASFFEQQSGTIIDMFNMFSGGALERFSILALGIMPYISASIIMQLMSSTMPALKEIKKEGESGRKKITQYTRFGTLGLATLQAGGVAVALQSQGIALYSGSGFVFSTIITLVTGTMFLMWLGEQISEKGIGNGISIIIFISIVSGLPTAVGGTLELASTGELNSALVVMILVLAVAVTAFVVFIERGQRKITVNYARRQQGRKMVQAQSSYLPLKLNMAGVIPPIFASSIILFPSTLGQWAGSTEGMSWLKDISSTLAPGQPLYVTFYAAAIIFFCFFYTALVYDSRETSDNLKKSGASIPGVRPGEQTSKYIDSVLTRLTAVGAIYITLVCLLPEFLIIGLNVPFYFGGTSLLIIVVVIMDFIGQLQSHMMNYQYGSLMKKSNLQGYKR